MREKLFIGLTVALMLVALGEGGWILWHQQNPGVAQPVQTSSLPPSQQQVLPQPPTPEAQAWALNDLKEPKLFFKRSGETHTITLKTSATTTAPKDYPPNTVSLNLRDACAQGKFLESQQTLFVLGSDFVNLKISGFLLDGQGVFTLATPAEFTGTTDGLQVRPAFCLLGRFEDINFDKGTNRLTFRSLGVGKFELQVDQIQLKDTTDTSSASFQGEEFAGGSYTFQYPERIAKFPQGFVEGSGGNTYCWLRIHRPFFAQIEESSCEINIKADFITPRTSGPKVLPLEEGDIEKAIMKAAGLPEDRRLADYLKEIDVPLKIEKVGQVTWRMFDMTNSHTVQYIIGPLGSVIVSVTAEPNGEFDAFSDNDIRSILGSFRWLSK